MNVGLQELLDRFDSRILAIAAKLHEVILSLNPTTRLHVNPRSRTLEYRTLASGKAFCTIELNRAVVKVRFFRGSELEDPHQLLRGSGKHRRLILGAPAQAKAEPVRRLIGEAIQHI